MAAHTARGSPGLCFLLGDRLAQPVCATPTHSPHQPTHPNRCPPHRTGTCMSGIWCRWCRWRSWLGRGRMPWHRCWPRCQQGSRKQPRMCQPADRGVGQHNGLCSPEQAWVICHLGHPGAMQSKHCVPVQHLYSMAKKKGLTAVLKKSRLQAVHWPSGWRSCSGCRKERQTPPCLHLDGPCSCPCPHIPLRW